MPDIGAKPNQIYERSDGARSGEDVFEQQDNASIGVEPELLDAAANDMSTAINDRLMRNGGNKPTDNLPMGGFKHTELGDGTDDGDSANIGQLNAVEVKVNAVEVKADQNTVGITSNDVDIATNAADILGNQANIAQNTANIGLRDVDIAANASDIAANLASILSNDTDIATNQTAIAANTTAIANNLTSNSAGVTLNAADIAINVANIATNATDIATNATNIVANAAQTALNSTAIGTKAILGHIHPIAKVTGLQTALDGKSAAHSHPYLAATGKAVDADKLDGFDSSYFAVAGHGHAIADVTGLQTGLDDLETAITTISSGGVVVSVAQVAGMQALLDAKLDVMAKAADSELLDGLDSTAFIKSTLPDIPSAINLDSYTITGLYHQDTDADAVAGSNYPEDLAGLLEVFSAGDMRYQRYWVFNTTRIYIRAQHSAGAWTAWTDITEPGSDNNFTTTLLNKLNAVEGGAQVNVSQTDNNYTTTEKNKLAAIEASADVNRPISSAINSTSTTDAASSKAAKDAYDRGSFGVADAASALSVANTKLGATDKAADSDKLDGHDTSYFAIAGHTHGATTDNNFTDALKTKLDGIEASADVNVITALSDAINSSSSTTAASSKAVKTAFDAALIASGQIPDSPVLNTQTFTSNGTWTKPASGFWVRIEIWGAGGSGGREGSAAGGGGGAFTVEQKLMSTIGATEAIVIGSGGASRSTNGDGYAGGLSSFGVFGAAGGEGGIMGNASDSGAGGAGGGGGGAGGVSATAASAGNPGADGAGFGGGGGGSGAVPSTNTNPAGTGGSAVWGGGGGGGATEYSAGTYKAPGGVSTNGGNGGQGGEGSSGPSNGSVPGGGGGAEAGSSGAGASGKIIIKVY